MKHDLDEMMQGEAEYFNKSALRRTAHGQIPMEADLRRATRFNPTVPGDEVVDPKMSYILEGKFRDSLIDYAAHQPKGKVVEICCGPGWLSLELGRKGQYVDAYDISPEAIALAKRMLSENPYKENFGSVTYHLQDVTKIDLGANTLDAIVGWAAWHHLPQLDEFMAKAYIALKPGGIIATLDDFPQGRLEKWLERILRLLLPTYDRTYSEKVRDIYRRITGKTKAMPEIFTPMEEHAHKDHAVFEIADTLYNDYDVLMDERWAAFSSMPVMQIKGPDWFRYSIARFVLAIDRVLCKIGVCKGFWRIIVAQKRA